MDDDDNPKRRRPNRTEKRSLAAAAIWLFIRRYGRKARKGGDPNDRSYDRDVQRQIKRMPPELLDRLMRDDDD